MRFKSLEEMYNYFGDCVDEECFGKEKKEIEDFLGDCKDYEFFEDLLYGECFIIKRDEEYFVVNGNNCSFRFERMDKEEIDLLLRKLED